MKKKGNRRSGFTLLEALLATVISLLLLGGLYVVVELQVNSTQNSRDAIAQATLARALMDRISRDMLSSITIKDPGPFRSGQLSYPVDDSTTTTDDTATTDPSATGGTTTPAAGGGTTTPTGGAGGATGGGAGTKTPTSGTGTKTPTTGTGSKTGSGSKTPTTGGQTGGSKTGTKTGSTTKTPTTGGTNTGAKTGTTTTKTPTSGAGGSGGSKSSGSGSGSSGAGASGGSGSGSGSSGSGSGSTDSSTATTQGQKMMFIPGVVGYADQVTTYQAVPLSNSVNGNLSNQSQAIGATTGTSGLRRISYWVVGQGDQAEGLARWETTAVSSPEAIDPQNLPTDPEEWIIAREVKSMKISYSDGSSGYWTDNWDSRAVSYDSSTPQGPPRAIKIELEMLGADGKTIRHYSQVVAIPVGNTVPLLETVGSGN